MGARTVGPCVSEVQRGVWRIVVSCGQDPATSKRRRIDRHFRGTKVEATAEAARLAYEFGHSAPPTTLSVKAYMEGHYLPAAKKRVRRKTYEGYESNSRCHIVPHFGSVKLSKLTPAMIDHWTDRMEEDGVGDEVRLHAFRVLRQGVKQALVWGMLRSDPTVGTHPPRVEERDLVVYDLAQANACLDAFVGHPLEVAVALAIGTGLRRSELCGLSWGDVDFEHGTLSIDGGLHQIGKDVWREPPKTKRSRRTIGLPSWVLSVLAAHRGFGPIVTLAPADLQRAYRKALEGFKLPYIALRDLRHTHATLALEAGVDRWELSGHMGHSSMAVTDARYLRPHQSVETALTAKVELLRLPTKFPPTGGDIEVRTGTDGE